MPATSPTRRAPALCRVLVNVLAALSMPGCAGRPARPPADIPVEDLRGSPLYTVLERDAIPSIDHPQFVSAAEATSMRDDEPVLGLHAGGIAKAYSLRLLDHHEIVNDTLGATPIAVTW